MREFSTSRVRYGKIFESFRLTMVCFHDAFCSERSCRYVCDE